IAASQRPHASHVVLANLRIMVRSPVVHEVVEEISREAAYHPLIDYFRSLRWPLASIWDRRPRLGDADNVGWFTSYCGVADSQYVRTVALPGCPRVRSVAWLPSSPRVQHASAPPW